VKLPNTCNNNNTSQQITICAIHKLEIYLFCIKKTIFQRSTIGQSVSCALFAQSGLVRSKYGVHHRVFTFNASCFALTSTTVRPVLKHGPRSSTGVRVVALF
jgi:hypothetical protein